MWNSIAVLSQGDTASLMALRAEVEGQHIYYIYAEAVLTQKAGSEPEVPYSVSNGMDGKRTWYSVL